MKKIKTLNQIGRQLKKKPHNLKVTFFSGVFDLFHYGHFRALRQASSLGDSLIVQIDGDKLVKKRKRNNRPYLDQSHRALIISSLEFVDLVFISDSPSEDASTLITINPDVFVRAILPHETDKDRVDREKALLAKMPKTKIIWLEQTPEVSTTKILHVVKISNSEPNLFSQVDKITHLRQQ